MLEPAYAKAQLITLGVDSLQYAYNWLQPQCKSGSRLGLSGSLILNLEDALFLLVCCPSHNYQYGVGKAYDLTKAWGVKWSKNTLKDSHSVRWDDKINNLV